MCTVTVHGNTECAVGRTTHTAQTQVPPTVVKAILFTCTQMLYIIYGGGGSGKSTYARKLAADLCAISGGSVAFWTNWSQFYRQEESPVRVVIVHETQLSLATFKSLESGETCDHQTIGGQRQDIVVQALIVCMSIGAPRPIAQVPVSLVINFHALNTLLDSSLGIKAALPILKQKECSFPFPQELNLPYKLWLVKQLNLPPEMCAIVMEAFTATIGRHVATKLSEWIKRVCKDASICTRLRKAKIIDVNALE